MKFINEVSICLGLPLQLILCMPAENSEGHVELKKTPKKSTIEKTKKKNFVQFVFIPFLGLVDRTKTSNSVDQCSSVTTYFCFSSSNTHLLRST